jgi:hypothetical protein
MTTRTHYNAIQAQPLLIAQQTLSTMPPITGHPTTADIEDDFWRELAEMDAESIGWLALAEGCYLHTCADSAEILIVGSASANMAGSNVLWVY